MRACLIALLVVLAGLPAAAAAAPTVGDAGLRVLASGDDYQREMDAVKAAGVPWISIGTGWAGLQPTADAPPGPNGPGGAEWRRLEQKLRYADSIGLRTFLQFTGAPGWATDGRANPLGNVPPRPDALPAYAGFFEAFARGMGPYVDAYSSWNEGNQANFWYPIDPVLFTRLQQAVYPAIKRGDPTGIVVSGTVYAKPGAFDFLRDSYRAGLRGSFDVLGWMMFPPVSPDTPPSGADGFRERNLSDMIALRALLEQLDPGRRIWIVEYSYSSCAPNPSRSRALCLTEAQQADYLTRAFTYMRRNLSVERLFWFNLRNIEASDVIEANYGLLRSDFTPKLAYAALRALGVEAPAGAGAGSGAGGSGAAGPAVPTLPAIAARPPQKAVFRSAGKLAALGRPRLRLVRGVFTLRLAVRIEGGASRVVVQGFRGKRWRPVARLTLRRSARISVKFRDRGYLGIRIRASRPGSSVWVASRVVRVPR